MSETISKAELAKRLGAITSGLSATVYGISLLDNPVGFVAATVIQLVVGWFTGAIDTLAGIISMIWGQFTGALTSAGSVATSPFATGGRIIFDLVDSLEGIVLDLAASAGPLAPLVAIIAWAVAFAALGLGFRVLLEVIKWVT